MLKQNDWVQSGLIFISKSSDEQSLFKYFFLYEQLQKLPELCGARCVSISVKLSGHLDILPQSLSAFTGNLGWLLPALPQFSVI